MCVWAGCDSCYLGVSHTPAWATSVVMPGQSGECGFSEGREERSWEKAAGQIAGIPEEDMVGEWSCC